MFDQGVPAGLKAFAEREFLGESLLWAARPDRRIQALLSCAIWLFAIPWTAFSLFWISVPVAALYESYFGVNIGAPRGAASGMMWAFAIFGVPFVLIGFGMLLAPLGVLWKGRRTLYVLTNRRLAVLEGSRTVTLTSILPGDMQGFSRKEGPDGRGTLIIEQGFELDSDGDRRPRRTEIGVIDGVRKVEEMVRRLKDSASARGPHPA
jgi:hypothetical protein